MSFVNQILNRLSDLISQSRFVDLESESLEIKPVPAESGEWKECHKRVNAFVFNKLEKGEFIQNPEGTRGYLLNSNYLGTHLI